MNKYQKPATIVVKLKYETLLKEPSANTSGGSSGGGGDSRELRSVWKDDEEQLLTCKKETGSIALPVSLYLCCVLFSQSGLFSGAKWPS